MRAGGQKANADAFAPFPSLSTLFDASEQVRRARAGRRTWPARPRGGAYARAYGCALRLGAPGMPVHGLARRTAAERRMRCRTQLANSVRASTPPILAADASVARCVDWVPARDAAQRHCARYEQVRAPLATPGLHTHSANRSTRSAVPSFFSAAACGGLVAIRRRRVGCDPALQPSRDDRALMPLTDHGALTSSRS
eukprot:4037860-Prymnesium_polylepis.1